MIFNHDRACPIISFACYNHAAHLIYNQRLVSVKFVLDRSGSPGRIYGLTCGKRLSVSSLKPKWSLTTCFGVKPSH